MERLILIHRAQFNSFVCAAANKNRVGDRSSDRRGGKRRLANLNREMAGRFAAAPVMFLMIVVFFAVSGAARQLGGNEWAPASEVVPGDGVAAQLLRQMYLQRLGAGPSCGTHSANGGCPH